MVFRQRKPQPSSANQPPATSGEGLTSWYEKLAQGEGKVFNAESGPIEITLGAPPQYVASPEAVNLVVVQPHHLPEASDMIPASAKAVIVSQSWYNQPYAIGEDGYIPVYADEPVELTRENTAWAARSSEALGHVSRHHCDVRVFSYNDGLTFVGVTDIGSTNGTFVRQGQPHEAMHTRIIPLQGLGHAALHNVLEP